MTLTTVVYIKNGENLSQSPSKDVSKIKKWLNYIVLSLNKCFKN